MFPSFQGMSDPNTDDVFHLDGGSQGSNGPPDLSCLVCLQRVGCVRSRQIITSDLSFCSHTAKTAFLT